MGNMNASVETNSCMDDSMLADRNPKEKATFFTDMLRKMVINAIKSHDKSDGVSFYAICKYVQENYHVDMNKVKPFIYKVLIEGVDNGVLDKTNASYFLVNGRKKQFIEEERFRIKEEDEKVETESQNVLVKDDEMDALSYDSIPSNQKLDGIKAANSPPTCGMVIMILNSIKNMNKRYGASFDEISKHMEEKYQIDMKVLGSYAKNTFEECVDNGIFEKINRGANNVEETFRIKEEGNIEIEPQNAFLKYEMDAISKYHSTPSNAKLDEIKAATSVPAYGMVMMILSCVKNLNKRYGASFDQIRKHMEEKYQVDMKVLGSYVKNTFKECIDNGILEKISRGVSVEERFRIKEQGNVETEPQNELLKDEMNAKLKNLRDGSKPSNVKLGIKAAICPPTRQMLIVIFKNCMKNLNNRNGASFSEISKYMEENHQVDMKAFSSYVKNVFDECVDNGMFEKTGSQASEEEKFKIKESENIAKVPENLLVKGGERQPRK